MSDRKEETDSVLLRLAAAPPKRPPRPPSERFKAGEVLLGRYRILDERGRGGMGRVFAVRDLRLDRDVAIKVLLAEPSDPGALHRFEREARAASRINHSHIATVYDVVSTEEGPGIVSELLEGVTLREHIAARGACAADEVRALGLQLAEGLAAAHEGGVVHRDLKPANLFLTTDGRLKILDFGLAKLLEPSDSALVTREGVAPGTLGYMSPEQVRGAGVDARSDLFAAGIVLYEMLAGRRPFEGASRYEIESRIVEGDPEPLPRELAPSLAAIVGRCLEKAPERRFQTARELAAALSGEDPIAAAGVPTSPLRGQAHPVRSFALAGALALACGLGWYALAHRGSSSAVPAHPSIAVLPFRDLSADRGQQWLSDGIAEEILTSLARTDGVHVAGRTSSFSFRDTTDDARAIGRKLGVATLLEGSVQRSGDQVRISARLVSAADGHPIWAQDFERRGTDILALEDGLARDVVAALRVKLVPGGGAPPANRGSKNPQAYADYLLARRQAVNTSKEELEQARRSIERALERDPLFAAAWAEDATILVHLASIDAERGTSTATMRLAAASADRAIALDPQLPDGYVIRSRIRSEDGSWDLEGARSDIEHALALSPNDAAAWESKGQLLLLFSRRVDEAIAALERATEIEPLDAESWVMLGYGYRSTRRFREARSALTRALEIFPQHPQAQAFLAEIELSEGHLDRALAMFDAIPDNFLPFRLAGRAIVLEKMARHRESRAALAELESTARDDNPLFVGNAYARLGDLDHAFEYFDRALAHHDAALLEVVASPWLDNVHADPRYQVLLGKMGLLDGTPPTTP